jgi:hypothetical protein
MFDIVASYAIDAMHRERAAVGHGHDGLGGRGQNEVHLESLLECRYAVAAMMPRTPKG